MKLRAKEPQGLLLTALDRLTWDGARVLDIGAGNVVEKNRRAGEHLLADRYAKLVARPGYLPLDVVPGPAVKLVGDAHALPVKTASLDGVLMVSVLEHLQHPHAAVDEVLRALRPGGLFFSYAPFYHPYHASPHDYFRFTHEGYRHLLRGFAQVEMCSGGNYVAVLNDVLSRAFGGSRAGRFLGRGLELSLRGPFHLLDARLGPAVSVGFAALATK